VGKLLRWIAGISAAFKRPAEYFLRPTSPPSDVADETGAQHPVAGDNATATVEVEFGQAAQVKVISTISPDQQEIQRRRELVRALFNDFWNGSDDKPVTFVDRLNQAETYLNERLTARGEPWQLDASARKMLGLPPRAN
jgi:hypothetical protein